MVEAATDMVVSREATLDSYRRGLEPNDVTSAYKVSTAVAQVGLYGVRSPEDALARIMTGRELGLTAMQSLRGLYAIDTKIGIDASLMHALCLQSSLCEQFECTSESDTKVEYTIRRRGWTAPQIVTWTIEDAERAGLVGRGKDEASKKQSNWSKYPRQMMHARCKADGARRVFPEKLFGLYTVEELYDGTVHDEPGSAKPAVEQSAKEAVAPVIDEMERCQNLMLAAIEKASEEDRNRLRGEIKEADEKAWLRGPYLDAVKAAYNARFARRQQPRPAPPTTTPEPEHAPAAVEPGGP